MPDRSSRPDWEMFLNLSVPTIATIFLFWDMHSIWHIPALRGTLGFYDIVMVFKLTGLNIFFHWLIHRGCNFAYFLLILLNIIALAVWYKYSGFRIWILINLSPLGFNLFFFRR